LIRSLIRELNEEGMTIFLTTHYIDEADQLCDRVAIIKQGRIVVDNSPQKLKSSLQGEHIVEVAFDRNGLDVEALRTDLGVQEVTKQGDKYYIHTKNPSVTIKRILQFAVTNEVEIVSINTKQPSLEDVFMKYTGLDAVQVERMELLRALKMSGAHG